LHIIGTVVLLAFLDKDDPRFEVANNYVVTSGFSIFAGGSGRSLLSTAITAAMQASHRALVASAVKAAL